MIGGALYAEDNATVADSTFLGNTAEDGGAIINYAKDSTNECGPTCPAGGDLYLEPAASAAPSTTVTGIGGPGDSLIADNAAHHLGGTP